MKHWNTDDANARRYAPLKLENHLCFALYAATRSIARAYRERLVPMGLTYPQYLVLVVLWEKDGLTLAEIGDRLMLDSGTLTPLVRRLEATGIVSRQRSTDDEREVNILLTAQGQALKDQALEARTFVGQRLEMSEAEVVALRDDVMAVISRLQTERRPLPTP